MSRWMVSRIKEQLSAAKGADVVHTLQQDSVLEARTDGPGVVVDTPSQLIGGKVGFVHLTALM